MGIIISHPGPPLHCMVHAESLSRVQPCVTPCTLAHQAPLSIEFSRQEYWSGLPCPSPGGSSPLRDRTQVFCIAGGFFTAESLGEAPHCMVAPPQPALTMGLSCKSCCLQWVKGLGPLMGPSYSTPGPGQGLHFLPPVLLSVPLVGIRAANCTLQPANLNPFFQIQLQQPLLVRGCLLSPVPTMGNQHKGLSESIMPPCPPRTSSLRLMGPSWP